MTTIQDNDALLLYRVGPVLCCSPCLRVISIIQPPKLTILPGQQSHHRGIFKHINNIIRVCECRISFGVDEQYWTKPGRIIITNLSTDFIGFWVDEIIDVIKWPQTGWGKPPPLIPAETFSQILLLHNQIYLYCEFEKLNAVRHTGFLKKYIEKLIAAEEKMSVEKHLKNQQQSKHTSSIEPGKKYTTQTKPFTASATPHNSQIRETKHQQSQQNKVNSISNINKSVTPIKKTKAATLQIKRNKISTRNNKLTHTTKTSTTMPATLHTTSQHLTKLPRPNVQTDNNSQISTNKPQTKEQHQYNKTQTNSGSFLALLSMIFLIFGAMVYYIFNNVKSVTETTSTLTLLDSETIDLEQSLTDIASTMTHEQGQEITPSKDPQSEPTIKLSMDTVTTIDKPSINTQDILSNQEIKNTTQAVTGENNILPSDSETNQQTDSTYSSTDYHAEITKNEQGITIVVHSPETEHKEQIKPTIDDSDSDQVTSSDSKKSIVKANKVVKTNTIAEQRVIDYVVVKGDTLWDIATFYIRDPYRYPELARLSNIKTPDLIYPGDRVRIILIYSNGYNGNKRVGRPRNRK